MDFFRFFLQVSRLDGIPFHKGQGRMGGIPKGLIHAAGFTDLHIRVSTEGVDHQVGCQRSATPQAFGRAAASP